MNEKYLVFYGYDFYPGGGWKDYQGCFNSFKEAEDKIKSLPAYDHWAHIVHDSIIICSAWGDSSRLPSDAIWIFIHHDST